VPVLAEETVKGAGLIEDGQVFIAVFGAGGVGKLRVASAGAAGADPISHAVGGQVVIVPADVSLLGGGADELISLISAQTTVSPATRRDAALIGAELAAGSCLIVRR